MITIDNAIETIQREYNRLLERNKFLHEENAHLRSEHYKDDELAAMKEATMKLNWRISHYGLTENEWKEMTDWRDEHLKEEHSCELEADKKGLYKMSQKPSCHIEIREFAECTCYSIVCSKCKKSHDVYN